ncbi:unnamed protein product [Notodromas monacha]|uniref:Spaetzle domain-containing protein n=1 Tax=Notodromas monacha TaxID=399045 RepID=A0A7R9GID8_9CRUS|nr:unnamed protein product [Notodromas monacha]CAG0923861.1 unnamed protein product [Notodromas monacha]
MNHTIRQAVRRFVYENHGLMRRMYGDVRQGSVLREELLAAEDALFSEEAAKQRYSSATSHHGRQQQQQQQHQDQQGSSREPRLMMVDTAVLGDVVDGVADLLSMDRYMSDEPHLLQRRGRELLRRDQQNHLTANHIVATYDEKPSFDGGGGASSSMSTTREEGGEVRFQGMLPTAQLEAIAKVQYVHSSVPGQQNKFSFGHQSHHKYDQFEKEPVPEVVPLGGNPDTSSEQPWATPVGSSTTPITTSPSGHNNENSTSSSGAGGGGTVTVSEEAVGPLATTLPTAASLLVDNSSTLLGSGGGGTVTVSEEAVGPLATTLPTAASLLVDNSSTLLGNVTAFHTTASVTLLETTTGGDNGSNEDEEDFPTTTAAVTGRRTQSPGGEATESTEPLMEITEVVLEERRRPIEVTNDDDYQPTSETVTETPVPVKTSQRPNNKYHNMKGVYEHKQMYCRDGCRCEQQYRLHRLLAFDPNNECRGIFSDWFKFPSCCVCKCYDLPFLRPENNDNDDENNNGDDDEEEDDQEQELQQDDEVGADDDEEEDDQEQELQQDDEVGAGGGAAMLLTSAGEPEKNAGAAAATPRDHEHQHDGEVSSMLPMDDSSSGIEDTADEQDLYSQRTPRQRTLSYLDTDFGPANIEPLDQADFLAYQMSGGREDDDDGDLQSFAGHHHAQTPMDSAVMGAERVEAPTFAYNNNNQQGETHEAAMFGAIESRVLEPQARQMPDFPVLELNNPPLPLVRRPRGLMVGN